MQRVYFAADTADAQLVCDLLNDSGHRAIVMGQALGGAGGDLPLSRARPEVWVEDDDAVAARALVERELPRLTHGASNIAPHYCPDCGYDLRGQEEPRCPECGRQFTERQPDWTCPQCGEQIEAQFSACWRCAGADPAADLPVEED